jgi:amino acid transporter
MNTPGQLPRVIGFTMATAIVVGTVIGSGVFKKANVVAANVPESGLALVAWVLVGVLTLLGALTLAEVAVIVGKAGGNYAILRDGYSGAGSSSGLSDLARSRRWRQFSPNRCTISFGSCARMIRMQSC